MVVAVTAAVAVVLTGLTVVDTRWKGASATPATAAAPDARTSWHDTRSGGTPRRYLLAAPPGPGPHPMLVVLHGLGQTTGGFLTATGLVPAALAAGVVVLGPETPDRSWNDGRYGGRGRDDDAFISALVDRMVARGLADRSRVVLAGFSNGSGMAVELLDRHPHAFAGALLVGGELLASPGAPRPVVPVETVLVHGTDDPVQPWAGRARISRRMPAQIGVPATVRAFLDADAVRSTTGRTVDSGKDVAVPHTAGRIPVVRQSWRGARDVTLYRLLGAGHVWPRGECPPGGCRPRRTVARLADVSATTLAVQLAVRARAA